MGNAVKLGDMGTDHDDFPPMPVISASSSVKADSIVGARQGDALDPHGRSISAGSSTVFADGKPVARSGDAIDCGGTLSGGGSVNIG